MQTLKQETDAERRARWAAEDAAWKKSMAQVDATYSHVLRAMTQPKCQKQSSGENSTVLSPVF